jgi:stage V sporulation protein SpoVS
MGANLAMNPAAVLTDRRHSNAQRLTDGAATLAQLIKAIRVTSRGVSPYF